eukprot:2523354-Prymnesium_polylepis.1
MDRSRAAACMSPRGTSRDLPELGRAGDARKRDSGRGGTCAREPACSLRVVLEGWMQPQSGVG